MKHDTIEKTEHTLLVDTNCNIKVGYELFQSDGYSISITAICNGEIVDSTIVPSVSTHLDDARRIYDIMHTNTVTPTTALEVVDDLLAIQ